MSCGFLLSVSLISLSEIPTFFFLTFKQLLDWYCSFSTLTFHLCLYAFPLVEIFSTLFSKTSMEFYICSHVSISKNSFYCLNISFFIIYFFSSQCFFLVVPCPPPPHFFGFNLPRYVFPYRLVSLTVCLYLNLGTPQMLVGFVDSGLYCRGI